MDPNTVISASIIGLKIASELVALYTRALEAANSGDKVAAENYLSEARARYSAAVAGWDAADVS